MRPSPIRGSEALNFSSIFYKILMPLVLSPLGGFLAGYLMMLALSWMFRNAHPRKVNQAFRKLQILSSAFMATSHGTNDAQKTMGIITLALFVGHQIPDMTVPFWVQLSCALAMAMGTATGGWKIIKTMGHKIFHLEAVHGFSAETSAAGVISVASSFGAPISTTHVISAAILGVGSSKRLSAVRWGVAGRMATAWLLTIPAAGAVAAVCFELLWLVAWWIEREKPRKTPRLPRESATACTFPSVVTIPTLATVSPPTKVMEHRDRPAQALHIIGRHRIELLQFIDFLK